MDIGEVCDRADIRWLMDRYALACDSCDWDAFRELFTADCVLDYTEFGGGRGDLESTISWSSFGLSEYAGLQHSTTSHYCELSGQTAKAITYFLAYHTSVDAADGEAMMAVGGFYQDRLVKQSDGWRIRERADLVTWLGTPVPERLTPPPLWYGMINRHLPRCSRDEASDPPRACPRRSATPADSRGPSRVGKQAQTPHASGSVFIPELRPNSTIDSPSPSRESRMTLCHFFSATHSARLARGERRHLCGPAPKARWLPVPRLDHGQVDS